MERYIEMKSKQSEEEIAQLAREKECLQAADYSIKKCVSMLGTMDVTKEEKVKAYSVFKIPENREIFLSACEDDLECALCWLKWNGLTSPKVSSLPCQTFFPCNMDQMLHMTID